MPFFTRLLLLSLKNQYYICCCFLVFPLRPFYFFSSLYSIILFCALFFFFFFFVLFLSSCAAIGPTRRWHKVEGRSQRQDGDESTKLHCPRHARGARPHDLRSRRGTSIKLELYNTRGILIPFYSLSLLFLFFFRYILTKTVHNKGFRHTYIHTFTFLAGFRFCFSGTYQPKQYTRKTFDHEDRSFCFC